MKNSQLKFSEHMQNISRSKSFGTFFLIVFPRKLYNITPITSRYLEKTIGKAAQPGTKRQQSEINCLYFNSIAIAMVVFLHELPNIVCSFALRKNFKLVHFFQLSQSRGEQFGSLSILKFKWLRYFQLYLLKEQIERLY